MTDSLTIRVSRSTHTLLRELAAKTNANMTAIVDEAVRDYQRKAFWADYQAAASALKAEPSAWADILEGVEAWDVTLADGLEIDRDESAGVDDTGPR